MKSTMNFPDEPQMAARPVEPAAPLPTHDQIAKRAYDIYVRSGRQPGRCLSNWLQAERELLTQNIALIPPPKRSKNSDGRMTMPDEVNELGSSHLQLSGSLRP